MKKVIGAEISRKKIDPGLQTGSSKSPISEAPANRSTNRQSMHVLDLSEPKPMSSRAVTQQPVPASPAPPTNADALKFGIVPDSSLVKDVANNLRSLEPVVPEPLETMPQAPETKTLEKRRKLPWRLIAVDVAKVAIVLASAVFFLSLTIDLPERFIGIYAVAAIVYRIDSQGTFLVALIFLVMVAVWSAIGNSVSAQSYAVYAFYFLVIGLVTAMRELLSTGKESPS